MKIKIILLVLFLMFISTNALSQNIIHGRITGDVQAGISVELYKTSCGGDTLVGTFTTNSEGYYAFGCLDNADYKVVPDNASYVFNLEFDTVEIPQTIIQSYDFIATAILHCPAGQTACGAGACVDLLNDESNCGSCGSECASNEVCTAATCELSG